MRSLRTAISFSLMLLCALTADAQQGYTELSTASPQLRKKYQKALRLYQTNQYDEAAEKFESLLEKNPGFIDACLMLASIRYEKKDFGLAEEYFNRVLKLNPAYNAKVFYTLALANFQNRHYPEAYANLNTFLEKEISNKDLLDKALSLRPTYRFADSASRHPAAVVPIPVAAVNSPYSEFLPSLTADGRTMVFTRFGPDRQEDLYISYRDDKGQWSAPEPIEELNTRLNEGAPSISADGRSLVFVSCHRPEGVGGCDLYVSQRKENGWGPAINMGDRINTPAFESQPCLAANGNLLFFCSDRIGGQGGRDIWMTFRGKNNAWVKPVNLGRPVNTAGNEECPFLHQDEKTLYFGSNGHTGMGGMDLFFSRLLKGGQWSQPVNLGCPVNTPLDESSFVAFYDGNKALMASDRLYQGEKDPAKLAGINLDIYEIEIPEASRPVPSCFIQFAVTDAVSKLPLPASVEIFRLDDQKKFVAEKLPASGKRLVSLPGDARYAINISHPGYNLLSEQFDCAVNTRLRPSMQSWQLQPVAADNARVVLKNIFFATNSAELRPESDFELDHLASLLRENKNDRILILGHTDDVGSEQDNLDLSAKRAEAVAEYLVSKGIGRSRIKAEGRGEKEPVADNATEEGRQLNRRTEFILKRS